MIVGGVTGQLASLCTSELKKQRGQVAQPNLAADVDDDTEGTVVQDSALLVLVLLACLGPERNKRKRRRNEAKEYSPPLELDDLHPLL